MASDPPADDRLDPDDDLNALTAAEAEQAEAAAALAQARAIAARARADLLRRRAEAADAPTASASADTEVDAPADADVPPDSVAPRRRRMLGKMPRKALWKPVLVAAAVVVVLAAMLGLSGLMAWRHQSAEQQRQLTAEYSAVARQGVVNLMSLNYTSAQDDVQRVIDNATGTFKENFEFESKFLVEALEESKVTTDVTVNAVAVESMNENSAVVLVAAQSQASNVDDDRRAPQQFRMAIGLARDNGQLKISQVDFV